MSFQEECIFRDHKILSHRFTVKLYFGISHFFLDLNGVYVGNLGSRNIKYFISPQLHYKERTVDKTD